MELHGRQIFDLLGKPLGQAMKFISALSDGSSLKSAGGSGSAHYKPSPSTHSPMTSTPLIPAFAFLLVGFLILFQSPTKVWLTKAEELPTLAGIFSFSRKAKAPSLPRSGENVGVWAKQQSGFYYCQGGNLFGSKPGEMMAQSEALTSGYRPAGGTYCANSQQVVASASSEGSSTLVAATEPGTPVSSGDVRVWGLKQLGFYYCQGDTLFGVRPGRLMTQAEALDKGLIPSYHSCSGSNQDRASTSDLIAATATPSDPANASSQSMEPSILTPEKLAENSHVAPGVSVWVKKEFGFYYCRTDVLFGNRPGQLMSQADALAAGYQPSDGHCSSNHPTRASAERLPSGIFPGTK